MLKTLQSSGDGGDRIGALEERVRASVPSGAEAPVGSDLSVVHRGLSKIRREGLAPGTLFCDWGSGLGGVCAVAALNGFRSFGIEIRGDLVQASRRLARELELPMHFAEGSFLLPGDEDLMDSTWRHERGFDGGGWEALGLTPRDCDVVFSYPWPGEEACIDAIFARHAAPGAVLLTFHGWRYLLAQRKPEVAGPLESLGWL